MVKCTLYITHCLRLNLQLHTIDLVRTCRISSFCTVAWQLARFNWYDASRGPSAIAELLVIVIGPPSAAQSAAELRWAYKMLLFSFLTNWTYQTDLHHRLQKYMKLSILRKFWTLLAYIFVIFLRLTSCTTLFVVRTLFNFGWQLHEKIAFENACDKFCPSCDTPNFPILHRLSWSSLRQCKHYHATLW